MYRIWTYENDYYIASAGTFPLCMNTREVSEELIALRAKVKKLERIETIAESVNEWLKTSANLKGTAHQRELEAALKGE